MADPFRSTEPAEPRGLPRWAKLAGIAVAVVVLIVVVMMFAGGGGHNAPDHGGGDSNAAPTTGPSDETGYVDGAAFTECMREQGIDMSDPDDEGELREAMEGVMDQYDQATIGRAMSVCGDLMPLQAPGHDGSD